MFVQVVMNVPETRKSFRVAGPVAEPPLADTDNNAVALELRP